MRFGHMQAINHIELGNIKTKNCHLISRRESILSVELMVPLISYSIQND